MTSVFDKPIIPIEKMMKVLLVAIQVLLYLSVLIQSNSVSLADEQHSSVQARARHDILLAEGIGVNEHDAEDTKKVKEENEEPSPLVSHSESSALPGYGREYFSSPFSSNASEQFRRSFDSLSPLTSSTSKTQKAIRDALTSGSTSLADLSSLFASQSSSSSSLTATSQNTGQTSSSGMRDHHAQDAIFENQKIEALAPSPTTSDDPANSGHGRDEEQVISDEEITPVHPSSSSKVDEDERRKTQQMVPYQSPRPPNIRAPQVFSSHLQRHWTNKHAWFATRRPLPRPFFYRPRTSPPTHGKYISSTHRTQKYMRPVDYVRNRFYPKRRNMFPSQFQRRPSSFFPSFLHPHSSSHSSTSSHMANHQNQMHTTNTPLFMMYPMNLRNWFLNNPLFSGTRRPIQSMNPSILAFPFPTITNRLPPSKFNAVNNQNPRKSSKRGRKNLMANRGGIKTAASTTSSTYTIDFGSNRPSETDQQQRSSYLDKRYNQLKYRYKKTHNSKQGPNVMRFTGDPSSSENDAEKGIRRSTVPLKGSTDAEKLISTQYNYKKSNREKIRSRVARDVEMERRTYRKHFGSYGSLEPKDVKKSPIIVPVSSYISFITSSSNNSSPPHLSSLPSQDSSSAPFPARIPDVTLTAEPTLQLYGAGQAINKHDIHHHYYYNDRSDSGSDEEDGYARQKGKYDEEQKRDERRKEVAKEEAKEKLEKRRKQKAKEKKFMHGKF